MLHVFGEAVDVENGLLGAQVGGVAVGLVVPATALVVVLVIIAVVVHETAVATLVLIHVIRGESTLVLVLVVVVVVPVHVWPPVVVEAVVVIVVTSVVALLVVAAAVVVVAVAVVAAAGAAELLVAVHVVIALVTALVVVFVSLVAALVLAVALVVPMVVASSLAAISLEPDLELVLARQLHGLVVPPVDQLLGLLLSVGVDESVDFFRLEVDLGHVGGLVDALEELGAELVQLHLGREAVDEDDRRHDELFSLFCLVREWRYFRFFYFSLVCRNRSGLSFGCAVVVLRFAVELIRVRFPAWAGWWAADQNEISSKFSKLKIKFQIYGTKFKPCGARKLRLNFKLVKILKLKF